MDAQQIKQRWHLECALSGVGHFFHGTFDQAVNMAKTLLATDNDFAQIVIWRSIDNVEVARYWKTGRNWVNIKALNLHV